jgi:mannose-6-phosphate isomerase class I
MEFVVGKEGTPRVLVCISGEADLKHDDLNYAIRPGNVILLPAAVGACFVEPLVTITLLEIGLPEGD